jgi:hypothetical protein
MVTFIYRTTGAPVSTSGTLGSAPVGSNDQATFTTTPPQLPAGVVTVTADYSGDSNYAASKGSIIYFVDEECHTGAWPAQTTGYPPVVPGDPTGYYIGQSNGWWTVYMAHPGGNPVKFTGNVTTNTNAHILDVSALKNESTDSVTLKGDNEITFHLTVYKALDGVTFFAGCGSELTFTLNIRGAPAHGKDIYLGKPPTKGTISPDVFTRSS